MSKKKIDIRPDVSSLLGFRNSNYMVRTAMAEFLDNSTASFLKNDELRGFPQKNERKIWIIFDERDKGNKKIIIEDNAYGMNFNDFERAVKIDRPPKDSTGRNEFGKGLKTASFWFSNKFSVATLGYDEKKAYFAQIDTENIKNGESKINVIEVNRMDVIHNNDFKFIAIDMNNETSGTRVVLEELRKKPTINSIEIMINDIKSRYRKDINSKNKISFRVIKLKKNKLNTEIIDLVELIKKKENTDSKCIINDYYEAKTLSYRIPKAKEVDGKKYEKLFSFIIKNDTNNLDEDKNLRVKGKILFIEKTGSKYAGLTLLRRNRVIEGGGVVADDKLKPNKIFGSPNSFASQRIYIEAELNNWPVSQQKDAFIVDDKIRDKLYEEIKEEGKEIISFANKYRERKTTSELKQVNSEQKINLDQLGNEIKQVLNDKFEIEINGKSNKYSFKFINKDERTTIIHTRIVGHDDVNDDEWIVIDPKTEKSTNNEWEMKINLGSPIFDHFNENKQFLEIIHRISAYIGYAEILNKDPLFTNGETKIKPEKIRRTINELFKLHK